MKRCTLFQPRTWQGKIILHKIDMKNKPLREKIVCPKHLHSKIVVKPKNRPLADPELVCEDTEMAHDLSPATTVPDLQTSGDLIADRRFGYAMALLQEKDGEAAKDLFTQVLERVPYWPPALLGMGDACLLLSQENEAAGFFNQCLAYDPSDRLGAGPRLARMNEAQPDHAIRHAYIATLFDDYAKRFDTHLINTLGYSAPQQLLAAITTIRSHFEQAYDLGCGTGLMGEVLRPHVDHLSGCDLSRAMLQEARAKQIYDQLDWDEGVHALKEQKTGALDLVTAADVLVYIGALTDLFEAVHHALKIGGLFAFTTQACGGERFIIGDDLRSAHSEIYLRTQARQAGFEILAFEAVSVRQDRDQAVRGWLCVLRKSTGV
jgi:predicted TPR repeat methyltransferase